MKIQTSKVIISIGIVFSLFLSAVFLFSDVNIINTEREDFQISNRVLFYLVLFIFQARFFYLINFVKKNNVTHQAISRLKYPNVTDAITGIFLFCILPLVLTHLNIYFNQSLNFWYLIFFLIYILGTSITLISEFQRRQWKIKNKSELKIYSGGLYKHALYINYFGEILSQPAMWFIATGVWWISFIALCYQLYDFLFVHIPRQEKYLHDKYKAHFLETSFNRKKLIPKIY
ncbi:MAG: DUF1295 domain-containing protein [Candidatus Marinimicrobia bacterium]|nr:DUF1295 domain-containing protein [Candidatus Neomarinimicrobiota bacterium]MBL7011208.1 DUF1295 domain-containing protein [Candidatus Neomarinimicrobiota bacterium]MBL7030288.1 DUF1295 domain-containing protein [Candidatus Neomarinimicrobiota bacterium]